VAQISIRDQIRRLIDLQKIDSDIYGLKEELTRKPILIGELKEKFEKNKAHLNELEEKLKKILLGRKSLELELKGKEDEHLKANTQLSQIKTNKEYQAKIAEMEHIRADQSILEEKILIAYDEADAVGREIEKERGVVAQEEKRYLAQKNEMEDQMTLAQDRIKVLESQRKQILPDIDPHCLNRYERVLMHKSGLAIARLQGNSCGGCFMNVTQQQINTIRMHDQLVECEMCQRILYIEDDL